MKKYISISLLATLLAIAGCDAITGGDITTKEGFEKAVTTFVEQVDTTKEKVLEFSFSSNSRPGQEFSKGLGYVNGSVIAEKGDTLEVVYHLVTSQLTKEKKRTSSDAAREIDAKRKVFSLSALSADRYLQHIEVIKKELPAEYDYQAVSRYGYCVKDKGIEERFVVTLTKKGEARSYYEVTALFINGELEDIS